MIYTSYFAKLRSIPGDIVPVSISLQVPVWYTGLCYRKLAPTPAILGSYHRNSNIELYMYEYLHEVLNQLDPKQVISDLENLTGTDTFALLCYESPEKFCHRILVSLWLEDAGYQVKEY